MTEPTAPTADRDPSTDQQAPDEQPLDAQTQSPTPETAETEFPLPEAEAQPPPAEAETEPSTGEPETGTPPPEAKAEASSAEPGAHEAPVAEQDETEAGDEAAAEDASNGSGRRKGKGRGAAKGKGKGAGAAEGDGAQRPPGTPAAESVVKRIGRTNARALAYVQEPDPQLGRLSRKVREALIPELPPVTAGALLGPAALTRHFVASAAAGRYRDLFALWELFRLRPDEAKPVLAERSVALDKGRRALATAARLGLVGNAERVAEDIRQAQGLIWQWLREALVEQLDAVGRRPAVASALLLREPGLDVPLPSTPDEGWLHEAAAARGIGPLAEPVESLLEAHVHRLPATVATLRLATLHYPERVSSLVDRVDLDAPEIGAFLAWARDHGAADRLHGRIREQVAGVAARDRAGGLALWHSWTQRGVRLELPEPLRSGGLDEHDLTRPETAELAARLEAAGNSLNLQARLDLLAGQSSQRAEKAYEAMVCAGLDVQLPAALEGNPAVREGTRCPNCRAWTWVRPGHEQRCPRPPAPQPEPARDPFELAAEAFEQERPDGEDAARHAAEDEGARVQG